MTARELKSAILQLAVQGKLEPQNPADEPASELLKRIRAEKAKLLQEGKIRKEKPLAPVSEDEKPFEIPESWEWVRLGTDADVQLGKMLDKGKNKGTPHPYLANLSVRWRSFDLSDLRTMPFTDLECEKFALHPGDVLMCEGGVPGRCAVWRQEHSPIKYQKAVHRIRSWVFFPDFIQLYFEAIVDRTWFTDQFTGTTIKHLPREKLIRTPIPLPPLAEQKRIVAKIEELMPLVEEYGKAEERLSALDAGFPDTLRKSILQRAIQGKLTKRDPADEPASELLKRIHAEKAKLVKEGKIKKEKPLPPIREDEIPFEIPASWEWVRIGELALKVTDGTHRTPHYTDTGVRFVSAKDICGESLSFDSCKYISEHEHEELFARCNPGKGDLLVSKSGSIGAVALVEVDFEFSLFESLALVKYDQEKISPRYLQRALQAACLSLNPEKVRGVAVKHLPIADIKLISIPLPPLAEQKRIVAKLEELLSLCDDLKAGIAR